MLECSTDEFAAIRRLHAASSTAIQDAIDVRAEDVRLALNVIGRAKPKGLDALDAKMLTSSKPAA